MKKITTSLTVDGDVVSRARALIDKSALPYSVSKLVTMLVFEAFDAIEKERESLDFPLIAQLRRSIHGAKPLYSASAETAARVTEMPAEIAELRHSDPERFATIEARLANIESLLKPAGKKKHS